MHEITLPRLSTNDDKCTLREWIVPEAGPVEAETVVALVEDSKSVVEVTATAAGFLKRNADVGKEYEVGAVIAYVFPDAVSAKAYVPGPGAKAGKVGKASEDMLLTKGARELMADRGISEEEVRALAKDVVRRSDIEGLLKSKTVPEEIGTELSKQQRTIGRVVMESHRSIPKAFLLVKMVCEPLLQRLEQGSNGLTEVLVKMLGDLARKYPDFYARLEGGTRIVHAEAGIHVGVTFDLGTGLFIPVVRDTDTVGLAEIAATLTDYRKKAMDGQFREQELTGGSISVSLNMNENVVVSIPIIVPGQACMVSLGGVMEEVARAPEGEGFAVRRYVNIGLAYDHRLINGNDAMAFLEALRRKIEYPGSNRWLA